MGDRWPRADKPLWHLIPGAAIGIAAALPFFYLLGLPGLPGQLDLMLRTLCGIVTTSAVTVGASIWLSAADKRLWELRKRRSALNAG